MKKIFVIIYLFIISLYTYSQEYPSFSEIEKKVTDSTLYTYYPKLIERFNEFDYSLGYSDYILIYYGFAFQESYNGYRNDPSVIYYNLLENKEYEKILQISDSILEKVPVCISSNIYKGKALEALNPDDETSKLYLARGFTLADVLFGSGDGKKIESAYKVLFFDDEKRIMYGKLDLNGYSKQALINHYDQLTVKKSDKFKQKKIYFDVLLLLTKSKWQ